MSNELKAFYNKGRINISREIREQFKIKEGDLFIVNIEKNKLILTKAKAVEVKNE